MANQNKKGVLLAAAAAVGACLLLKAKGSISGIGTVDNEWGANEMRLSVLNIEPLYYWYKNHVLRLIDMGCTQPQIVDSISFYLKNDIQRGRISLSSGMGRGEKARAMAAQDIYDAFYENREYEHKH